MYLFRNPNNRFDKCIGAPVLGGASITLTMPHFLEIDFLVDFKSSCVMAVEFLISE